MKTIPWWPQPGSYETMPGGRNLWFIACYVHLIFFLGLPLVTGGDVQQPGHDVLPTLVMSHKQRLLSSSLPQPCPPTQLAGKLLPNQRQTWPLIFLFF